MSEQLGREERVVLLCLASCGGGFTAKHLSLEAGVRRERRHLAIARTNLIEPLFKRGLIDRIDAEKPAVYVITNDGRKALATPTTPEASHDR